MTRRTCPPEIVPHLGILTDSAIVTWWRGETGVDLDPLVVARWRRARGIASIEGRGRPTGSVLVPVADLLTRPTDELRAVLGVTRQRIHEARRIGVSMKTRAKWAALLAANVTESQG